MSRAKTTITKTTPALSREVKKFVFQNILSLTLFSLATPLYNTKDSDLNPHALKIIKFLSSQNASYFFQIYFREHNPKKNVTKKLLFSVFVIPVGMMQQKNENSPTENSNFSVFKVKTITKMDFVSS